MTEEKKVQFKVLYNNDTWNILQCVGPWNKREEVFSPEKLKASIVEVAGTAVDAIMLSPGTGWIPYWKSKSYSFPEHLGWYLQYTGKKKEEVLGAGSSFWNYLQDGDIVKVFIEYCHKLGISPFISYRLNDLHHLFYTNLLVTFSHSRFYVEHPEYRIDPNSKHWMDQAQDWAIPEVREHKFSFIKELCENYDLAGIELDFLRHPFFFNLKKTDSRQRIAIMTDFIRRVRETLKGTASSGKRRYLGIRIPNKLSGFDPLGLDLELLSNEKLVDMVNISPSHITQQESDLAAIRKLCAGVALYFEMEYCVAAGKSLGFDEFHRRYATDEQLYTTAHLAYSRGADGISLFNFAYYRGTEGQYRGFQQGPDFFKEPPFHVLNHIADREWLARQSKYYFLSTVSIDDFFPGYQLPQELNLGETKKFTMDIAIQPEETISSTQARLRIQAEPLVDKDGKSRLVELRQNHWKVCFNGTLLEQTCNAEEPYSQPYNGLIGEPEEYKAWICPKKILKNGINNIDITLIAGKPVRVIWLDLSFQGKYNEQVTGCVLNVGRKA